MSAVLATAVRRGLPRLRAQKRAPRSHQPDRVGIAYWMRRVLHQCARVARERSPEAVHDLRVALRRCRSMADSLMAVDSSPVWPNMKKNGRRLFQRLGTLRDLQVMMGWVQTLGPASDPVRQKILATLGGRKQQLKEEARQAVAEFDRQAWQRWAGVLAVRAARVALDGPVFQHLALERWAEARALHRAAVRDRSQVAYHRLRIGLKRFRYIVENFLPRRHSAWGKELKRLQDLLGEVHDLDVLRAEFFGRSRVFSAAASRRWRRAIQKARLKRLEEYRRRVWGAKSLWAVWRAGLPAGKLLEQAAAARLAAWASFRDPRFGQTRRSTALAGQLFDGFAAASTERTFRDPRARRILQAAALLQDVGRAKGRKGHHKAAYRMISALPTPHGWSAMEMKATALVARYHRGAEPRADHAGYARLSPRAQRRVALLAGVLRLADGLAGKTNGRVSRVKVLNLPEATVLRAHGYTEDRRTASLLGGKKHLLETLLGRPLLIRPA